MFRRWKCKTRWFTLWKSLRGHKGLGVDDSAAAIVRSNEIYACFKWRTVGEQSFRDEKAVRLTFDFSVKRGIQRWPAWENKVNEMAKLRNLSGRETVLLCAFISGTHYPEVASLWKQTTMKVSLTEIARRFDQSKIKQTLRCNEGDKFSRWRFNSRFMRMQIAHCYARQQLRG